MENSKYLLMKDNGYSVPFSHHELDDILCFLQSIHEMTDYADDWDSFQRMEDIISKIKDII